MLEFPISVDDETLNMIHFALAVFKFRHYLKGFKDLSAYLASLSFEKVVVKKARKFGIGKCIDHLLEKGLIDKEMADLLRKCKYFRNDVMHGGARLVSTKQIENVLQTICNLVGLDYHSELQAKDFEEILMFGGGEELIETKELLQPILDSDFDSFIRLYEKCRSLRSKLQQDLKSIGLIAEEMSEFVPTSGSIWLPWVTEKIGRRSHMRKTTLGVTFTPHNIRIGLDFGSRAFNPKKRYYSLLYNGALTNDLMKLGDEYQFYDTFWYYNIRNKHPLRFLLEPATFRTLKNKIKDALEETRKAESLNEPMTENKFLIGKIYQRGSSEFAKILHKLPQEISNIFHEMLGIINKIELSA